MYVINISYAETKEDVKTWPDGITSFKRNYSYFSNLSDKIPKSDDIENHLREEAGIKFDHGFKILSIEPVPVLAQDTIVALSDDVNRLQWELRCVKNRLDAIESGGEM